MILELRIPSLGVSGDSKLVINQLLKEYEVKKEDRVSYFRYDTNLINKFDSVELEHVPREENRMANALANIATTLALRDEDKVDIPVSQQWVMPKLLDCRIEEIDVVSVGVIEADDWRQPLIDYLQHGRLPEDIRHKTVRRRAPRFIYYKDTLFRRSYEGCFYVTYEKMKLLKPWMKLIRRPAEDKDGIGAQAMVSANAEKGLRLAHTAGGSGGINGDRRERPKANTTTASNHRRHRAVRLGVGTMASGLIRDLRLCGVGNA
ncbi:hypothetical protein RJ640_026662 [Escallonia rubra]|uniref:RNase H type-1 domain-containing protein n=1 Tax=Escallonia rubra TaxID=112253 RepID=A0AA88RAR1_9ASTE|nr:hypothetical protein RJ640_026662 [Escallonia rubra]